MQYFQCAKCKQAYQIDDTKYNSTKLVLTCAKCNTKNAISFVPKLQLSNSEQEVKPTFSLKVGRNIIGRKNSTDDLQIAINDPYVSSHHAAIFVQKNKTGKIECVLIDLNSSNGTFLQKDKKIPANKGVLLKKQDIFTIGNTNLSLV